MKLSWLIVGGGIHGVHIAARLLDEGRVPEAELRILDPAADLLCRWRSNTSAVGMRHLRSPAVHHLGSDPMSLRRFAGNHKNRKPGQFAAPYNRPSLGLFNAHCEHIITQHGLRALHIQGQAEACHLAPDSITVRTAAGQELIAERIVLAIGLGDQLSWPGWAPLDSPNVRHIFEAEAELSTLPDGSSHEIAVVGGGISAAQTALRLAKQGWRVQLVARHPPRPHQFDSDPGWLGPKFMTGFEIERNLERRRTMILKARHRGSMPPDVQRALEAALSSGNIVWQGTEVENLRQEQGSLRLQLANGAQLSVARIWLATGFAPQRPGGPLVDELIAGANLPCAPCGYPIVDAALRWHPRIHVTGPLAELELGPSSRNIVGARRAAERLLSFLDSPGVTKQSWLTGNTAGGLGELAQPLP